ncbi:hypothetical protein [Parendozoicomonas haliclonae]|uniref:RING-type domain-containing protein n=1 Tax=Parendozoicomonas haliclonae TaxID=1960125 RepID=A0A1X7AQL5_9GAMM|nr:hypothetical protein [Parendozoicomonas haliclonae]SMA50601.1 hypothetical protein EHSB41UT_04418 [Parendozoicomonas haliclonae]
MATSISSAELLYYTCRERDFSLDPTSTNADYSDYGCGICHLFMDKPVKVCTNSHRYCKGCINRWQTQSNQTALCPTCQGPLNKDISIVDTQFIAGLKFFCPNACQDNSLPMKDIDQHLETCPEEIVDCPGKCGIPPLKRKHLVEHVRGCNKHFLCECGANFPNIPEAKLQQRFITHINENPASHIQLQSVQYLIQAMSLASPTTSVSGFQTPYLKAGPAKEYTFLGEAFFATTSSCLFQSKDNPRDFIMKCGYDRGPIESGKIPIFIDQNGNQVERSFNLKVDICADGKWSFLLGTDSLPLAQAPTVTVYYQDDHNPVTFLYLEWQLSYYYYQFYCPRKPKTDSNMLVRLSL